MKDTESSFRWIINILQNNNIPFQIEGGFASRLYGSNRELADIIFLYLKIDLMSYCPI